MALTRPLLSQLNTNIIAFSDNMMVINAGNVANRDLGIVFDRSVNSQSNVALFWQESSSSFTFAETTSSGLNNANIVVGLTSNVVLGNIILAGNGSAGIFYANGSVFGGGGGGTPGGVNGQLQFNNLGVFAGVSGTTVSGNNVSVVSFTVNASATIGTTLGVTGNINGSGVTLTGSLRATGPGDFDGGLQSTPIGNAAASTGSFTTIAATGTFTGTTVNAATIGNSGAALTGTIQTAAQTNITSVGTLTGLTLSGTFTGTTVNAATIGNSGAALTGTIQTAAQTNITSVGTLGSLAVTGNATAGNFIGTLNGSGANVSSISATNISSGTLAQARLANAAVTLGSTPLTLGTTVTTVDGLTSVTSTTFVGALTGAATTAATVTTAAQTNITSVGTLTGLTLSGTLTGTTVQAATIGNSGATLTGTLSTAAQTNITSVGNIAAAGMTSSARVAPNANATVDLGATGLRWNNVFGVTFSGVSTTAKYADLAEIYIADDNYPPGTVVVFGGSKEITVTSAAHDTRVAGVISTNPAYLMNSEVQGLPVALTGRVPCLVQGPINKGEVLVTGFKPGTAQKINTARFQPGCVVGKSIENISDDELKLIEIVVGRF